MKTAQVVGTLGIGIVVGLVAGLLIRGGGTPPSTDPCLVPGPHTIQVGSNGSLSCPTVEVRPGDSLTWVSPARTTLSIRLSATSLGQPQCPNGNTCTYTTPNIATSSEQTDYTATVSGGTPNPALGYGRIIIKK
jgi:hypothetical protein